MLPIAFKAPPAADPTLLRADPADDWTRDSPSDALEAAWPVASFALLAASDAVDWLRNGGRRSSN
jgi:hypothetical protein